jgi:TRAP-type mannitol/chloroaromatic compound transport system permease small subunit
LSADRNPPDGFVLPFYIILSLLITGAVYSFSSPAQARWLALAFAVLGFIAFTPVGLTLSRAIDAVNTLIGRGVAWLILLAVIISAINAIIRKAFDTSSNTWLELQWVLFGAVFLVGASWTLLANEHIRIDIVNSRFTRKLRNYVEIVGHVVFLLPFSAIMIITSIPFAMSSFRLNEQSMNAGGLPQWPAKFLLPIGFILLFAQGISELAKRVAMMRGKIDDTGLGGGHHDAAEAEARRLLEMVEAEKATTIKIHGR